MSVKRVAGCQESVEDGFADIEKGENCYCLFTFQWHAFGWIYSVSWPQARGDLLGLFPDSLIGTLTDKQGAKSTLILVKPGCLMNRNLFFSLPHLFWLNIVPVSVLQQKQLENLSTKLTRPCFLEISLWGFFVCPGVYRFTDVGLFPERSVSHVAVMGSDNSL